MADISQVKVGSTTYDIKDKSAITNITRSGTTFTATKHDGTTFTFDQQDNNTTYTPASSVSAVATTSAVGTSTAYARQDHVHNITKATITSALGYTPPTASDVTDAFRVNDAMLFKGTLGTGGTVTALPATHYQGWTYKVITAGTWAGKACEVGDMIICITDGTAANNDHWTVVQTNIDGAVTGPASATDARFAAFNGTTGKIIKDSGYSASSFSAAGHTHNYAGSPSAGGSATSAIKLDGFTASSSQSWGNQTGTLVHAENDSTGGSWTFRRDNPSAGQVSFIIDGDVYIKEGGVRVGDAIKSITRSGTTFTYTTLWGNTGTFTQQDNNTWRGIQDNLTSSTNTTESLSAKQGYLLANGSARDNTKLPLAGGNMTGEGGIQYPIASGNTKPNNWISAGGGYSANSGKSGVKIICCEQADCLSGLGQDLSGLGGYDLSIVGGKSSTGTGYISFVQHTVAAPTTYTRLGYFNQNGDFHTKGSVNIADHVTQQYNTTTQALDFIFS